MFCRKQQISAFVWKTITDGICTGEKNLKVYQRAILFLQMTGDFSATYFISNMSEQITSII